jgi:anaerobic ribonucleoside-triphosphate reductase activating protein
MLPLDRGGRVVPVGELAEAILATDGIEGLTLAGGEPVAQAGGCAELAEVVQGAGLSVMLFTGYTLDELRALGAEAPEVPRLLGAVDLLVDGPYLRERPETRRRWIGSSNQVVHALTRRYDLSDPAFLGPNTVELRLAGAGGGRLELVVNGWPEGARKVRFNGRSDSMTGTAGLTAPQAESPSSSAIQASKRSH